MDTQVIELVGRNRLMNELLAADLEVAIPLRDRGIDLIAYVDLVDLTDPTRVRTAPKAPQRFTAIPIQMKAASRRSFSISRKYSKLRDLILAFVWHLENPADAVTYALTYREVEAIAESLGWTQTASWTQKGQYDTTRPSAAIIEKLEPFRMTPDRWRAKLSSGVKILPDPS